MREREVIEIRDAVSADAPVLADIYNYYIRDTIVTFEEAEIDGEDMLARICDVQAAGLPWLVAEQAGTLLGYAYATGWRARAAYRFCTEITVYLRHGRSGRGVGSALYERLFARLAERGMHVVLGCIALPNEASVVLHEKFGMKKVAHFSEVGFKFGRWIDVGYWQRNLG
jgi:phosphinothricin acetyltransferase